MNNLDRRKYEALREAGLIVDPPGPREGSCKPIVTEAMMEAGAHYLMELDMVPTRSFGRLVAQEIFEVMEGERK